MQVAAIRAKGAFSLQNAPPHRNEGVDRGKGKKKGKFRAEPSPDRRHGKDGERKSEQLRARVTHEKRGGGQIEGEKAEQAEKKQKGKDARV